MFNTLKHCENCLLQIFQSLHASPLTFLSKTLLGTPKIVGSITPGQFLWTGKTLDCY
uniref:Uncharacterized protein n=1 Tax=Rhizophora mucronata TaxID=61149 RepID=A0A2P2NBT5_RHIMU